jgi:V/A-type H+-transporting ATPase subunit K
MDVGLAGLGAGIAIAATGIAAGIAEMKIGGAAVRAMRERGETFSKALILTVIPETIVIFGLVISIMVLGTATS